MQSYLCNEKNKNDCFLEGSIGMAKYKSKIKNSQLTVKAKLSSGEKVNERELDFFSQKHIRGLLKAKLVRRFGRTSIQYTGPTAISLLEYLKKPITKYNLLFIIEQMILMVQKIQANSMSLNKLVWDINQVYINETTRELQHIYLPLEVVKEDADLLGFLNQVIYAAQPVPEQNSDYISRFVYFINSLNSFDTERIENFIYREDRSVINTLKEYTSKQSDFMTDKQSDYYKHYDEEDEYGKTELLDEDEETGLLGDEEEDTGVLEEGEGTGILEEQKIHYPILYRVLTEENIDIDKPVFRIGKERNYVDYFVSNNSAISRSHADIITREQKCYVMDLNSKNKTYVNNQQIPAQQEIEISNGDCLKLANEEFIFYY